VIAARRDRVHDKRLGIELPFAACVVADDKIKALDAGRRPATFQFKEKWKIKFRYRQAVPHD
jgi:hypothetical protein